MYIEGMKESRLPSLFSVPFSLQRKFRWGFSRGGGILFGFQLFWSQKHFYRGDVGTEVKNVLAFEIFTSCNLSCTNVFIFIYQYIYMHL